MSQNRSEPNQNRQGGISPLPPRAEAGMTRAAQQRLFEQLRTQVLDTATRHFDQSLRVLKTWMVEDEVKY